MLQVITDLIMVGRLSPFAVAGVGLGLYTLLRFALFLSIPVSILWYFLSSYIFIWFDTAQEVIDLGSSYMQVLTFMMPFIFVKLVFVSALSASGDTKTPMYIKLVSIILNIFLNYILIFGHFGFPAIGVVGAGISTVIINGLELAVYIILYLKGEMIYTPYFYFSKSLLNRALKVGLPASIERTLTFGSFMLFTETYSQTYSPAVQSPFL